MPRFLFTDFPLGNPCGTPWDVATQTAILEMAFELLESARYPRTTVQTPFEWSNEDWRTNFMRVDEADRERLKAMGEERRADQASRKTTTAD